MTCVNLLCDEPAKTRGLCVVHYRRLQYGRKGPVTTLDELCRAGLNRACVDCGDVPLFGGKRCGECFLERVDERRGVHTADSPVGAGYGQGCRCRPCMDGAAQYQRERRKRKAAA